MSGYDVSSKGKYNYPQPDNVVPVESFLFVREEGKKYLLLKFNNPRKSILTGIDLEITQLGAKGKQLGVKGVKYGEICAKPEKPFVLTHRIEVDPDCVDVKVKVVAAMYGKYAYSVKNGVNIEYSPAPEERFDPEPALNKLGWESREVSVRTLKRRISIALLSCILLALILTFTALHLIYFTRTENSFLYSGIEYEFTDYKNKADCDIVVTGYKGKFVDAVIPTEIDGHRIAGIAARAFENNTNIRTLTVESGIEIQTAAFSGCKNLEQISIDNVSVIGSYAFRGCASLKSLTLRSLTQIGNNAFEGCASLESVDISNEELTLVVGEHAFANCSSLNAVSLAQKTVYPASLFTGSVNLKHLELLNFSGSKTISSLFGTSSGLETLSIENLDAISDNFCVGLPLTSVKIENLTSAVIGNHAFDSCPLKVLDIPVKPTAVGDYAFRGAKFETFIENELTEIGNYAFDSSSLTEFDATQLLSVGDYAFASSTGLKLVKFNDNSPCTYLGEGAFSGCTGLVTITVPAGITVLSDKLFQGCSSLAGVTYAGRVTEIGKYAYAQCTKLTELQIIDSVSVIGDYAFSGCTSVVSARIPRTVNALGKGMLNGCSNLSKLTLSFGQYSDVFLGGIFGADSFAATSTYMPSSLKAITVESASQIPANAFYGCSQVEEVSLPDTLNSIGENAFSGCTAFTSFRVPDSVNSIGRCAFRGSDNLSEITLPFVGGTVNGNSYLGYIFSGDYGAPEALKTVTVTSAAAIADNAFYDCRYLENINLPDTLKTVGNYAFGFCSGLRKIVLPSSLERVGFTAFEGCFKLYEIWNLSHAEVWAPSVLKIYSSLEEAMVKESFGGFEFMYSEYDDTRYLTGYESSEVIELPDYYTYSVAAFVFASDQNIQKVIIPECVTHIGDNAFSDCRRLKLVLNYGRLNIVAGNYDNGSVAGNAIYVAGRSDDADYADVNGVRFVHCNDNWTAVWNVDATRLELNGFTYNGKTVSSFDIDARAFEGDARIIYVEIGSAVSRLGEAAFNSCTSLQTLIINNPAFGEIPAYAFSYCFNLQTVQLSSGITKIGDSAFRNAGITSVALPSTLTEIGAYAFANTGLVTVTVPYSVKALGQGAFDSCTQLEKATVNAAVSSLESYVFNNCAALKSVTLPASVRTVGEYAFAYCLKLEEINLPSALTAINNSAFMYCNSLTQITLPSTLSRIDSSAFANCTNLLIVYNLSPLKITERSADYGSVARYAVAVFTSIADKAEFSSEGDYAFVSLNGKRYLYSYKGYSDGIVLPKTDYGYTVKNYAFESVYITYAVIPECVEKLEASAFYNSGFTVYYYGTEEKWKDLTSDFNHGGAVYTYAECVHENGKWTYDGYGNISTVPDLYGFDKEVTKQPTCVDTGIQTQTCPNCGHKVETVLDATGKHEYDEDGVCINCGKERE